MTFLTSANAYSEQIEPKHKQASIVVFGFDSAEPSQVRRIKSLMALGHDVHAFTMRRGNRSEPIRTDFPNTHLFWTDHEKLFKRALIVAASVLKVSRHNKRIRSADIIVARNLDMLALAWATRRIARTHRTPMIYECLDIHNSMTGSGWKNKVLRRAEKFLLGQSQMLATSSPTFLEKYFKTEQDYHGPTAIWENKLIVDPKLPDRGTLDSVHIRGPLKLGWVGSIRCQPSLILLRDLALEMGPDLEVHIHGKVHEHAIPDFQNQISGIPNLIYHGPYQYPVDLPKVYGGCHLIWNVDLWLQGGNSDWALSNRLYEASWCGRPSIGMKGTAIGQYILEHDLGWTIGSDKMSVIKSLISSLNQQMLEEKSRQLLDKADTEFASNGSELQATIDHLLGQSEGRSEMAFRDAQ